MGEKLEIIFVVVFEMYNTAHGSWELEKIVGGFFLVFPFFFMRVYCGRWFEKVVIR